MLNQLPENCCSKCHHGDMDSKQIECGKCDWKESVASTSSCDANYSSYGGCHLRSETSTKTLPSKVTDTCEVLLHHTSNKSNDVTDRSVQCDTGSQEMSSRLSQALM
jgi:hypothetical protein